MGCFSSKALNDKQKILDYMIAENTHLRSTTERLIYENSLLKNKNQILDIEIRSIQDKIRRSSSFIFLNMDD